MKRYSLLTIALAAALTALNAPAQSGAGEVDFSAFAHPARNGSFVDINLSHDLLSLAGRFVEKQNAEVAKLLNSVQLLRLNVIGLTDENRDVMQKTVRELRNRLDKGGWQRIVTVQKTGAEDVGIYLKLRSSDAIEGLVISVINGQKGEAVLINLVGDIKPEQIAAVGEALNIEPLKQAGGLIKK